MKEKVKEKMSRERIQLKALQLTLDKLDKTYGKGTVMKMGDKAIEEVETISSGLRNDLALELVDIQEEELLKYTVQNLLKKTT
jgi:recombination protein RecA